MVSTLTPRCTQCSNAADVVHAGAMSSQGAAACQRLYAHRRCQSSDDTEVVRYAVIRRPDRRVRSESLGCSLAKVSLQQRGSCDRYRRMVQSFTGLPQTEAQYGWSAFQTVSDFGVFSLTISSRRDMLVREFLIFPRALLVILGDHALLKIGKILVGVTANVAHGDARSSPRFVDDLVNLRRRSSRDGEMIRRIACPSFDGVPEIDFGLPDGLDVASG